MYGFFLKGPFWRQCTRYLEKKKGIIFVIHKNVKS